MPHMLTKNNERGFIRELWTEGDKGLKSPINPQESVTDGNFMHGFILHMILEKNSLDIHKRGSCFLPASNLVT